MRPDSFQVHVAKLRRRPGSRQEVQRSVPVPGLGLSSATVRDGSHVSLDLVLESIHEGIVASGTVSVGWQGPCRRCLEEVEGTLVVDVKEIFESSPVEGETWPLDGDQVDLEPMVRDNVLLALPLAPLCDEACLGPVPGTFPARSGDAASAASAGHEAPGRPRAPEPTGDPRWAVLDEVFGRPRRYDAGSTSAPGPAGAPPP